MNMQEEYETMRVLYGMVEARYKDGESLTLLPEEVNILSRVENSYALIADQLDYIGLNFKYDHPEYYPELDGIYERIDLHRDTNEELTLGIEDIAYLYDWLKFNQKLGRVFMYAAIASGNISWQ